jgi:hypothetical protein
MVGPGRLEMADTKAIQSRLGTLKNSLSQLNKTLVDNRAKGYLLRPASNSLSDVETFLLPRALKATNPAYLSMWREMADFELRKAEERLKYAQDMVSKYGENLQAIG